MMNSDGRRNCSEKAKRSLSVLLKRKPLRKLRHSEQETAAVVVASSSSSHSRDLKSEVDEPKLLLKSEIKLAEKAKIYDCLAEKSRRQQFVQFNKNRNITSETADEHLIDFDQKIINEDFNRKELLQASTQNIAHIKNYFDSVSRRNVESHIDAIDLEEKGLESKQIKALKSDLKLKSGKNLTDLIKKPESDTYQDLKIGNIDDHGVGYFEFSRDKTTREAQMKFLNELRENTKKMRNE